MALDWFSVNQKAKIGELFIYGEISNEKGWDDDVVPLEIVDKLKTLQNVSKVNMYVNSPGGSVFAGMAIYNLLTRFPKPITAYVDGLAASIASVILMAADKIYMPETAMFMLHNPSGVAMGESEDMRKTADLLDKVKEIIVDIYVKKSGLSQAEVSAMMDKESWYTGVEAFASCFVTGLVDEKGVKVTQQANGSMIFNGLPVDVDKFKAFPMHKVTLSKYSGLAKIKSRFNVLKNNI